MAKVIPTRKPRSFDKTFNDCFGRLEAFRARHGHLRVTNKTHGGDTNLFNFVKNLRANKAALDRQAAGEAEEAPGESGRRRRLVRATPEKLLTPGRIERLEAIGFEWETGYVKSAKVRPVRVWIHLPNQAIGSHLCCSCCHLLTLKLRHGTITSTTSSTTSPPTGRSTSRDSSGWSTRPRGRTPLATGCIVQAARDVPEGGRGGQDPLPQPLGGAQGTSERRGFQLGQGPEPREHGLSEEEGGEVANPTFVLFLTT